MLAWLRRLLSGAPKHDNEVPDDGFRLMILDDNPFPTYIGRRSWCDGTPYWEDGTCRCTHTEERP